MIPLEQIGIYLFGEYGWQHRLAEELQVNRRTVARWRDGIFPVPNGEWGELHALVAVKRENDAIAFNKIMMGLKGRV